MNTDRDIQIAFLKWVKERSIDQNQFVDSLGNLLVISRDSAYRRMRGETLLTFNEIRKISLYYKASLDTFFNHSKDSVLFQKRTIDENYTYQDFLRSLLNNLNLIDENKGHKLTYIAKDIPPFHYFQFPDLTIFKSFFWLKTILKAPEWQDVPYGSKLIAPEILQLTRDIWRRYQAIPSLEIWSDETINITLRQIEFYYDSQILTGEQAGKLIDDLSAMVRHLKKEAEQGLKLGLVNGTQRASEGKFELYHNEIEIGDNTVLFTMGERRMVLKTYNMLSILSTADQSFCGDIEQYINNILQKSIPISTSSEKERVKFFNMVQAKIEEYRKKML